VARYQAIGGASPLGQISAEFARGMSEALTSVGCPMSVKVGMRYSEPSIERAVAEFVNDGVQRIIVMALSPHATRVTHGEYRAAVDAAVGGEAEVVEAQPLSTLSTYVHLHAEAAAQALAQAPATSTIVFQSHSLPLSDVAIDDGYVCGVEANAQDVAARLRLPSGRHCQVLPGIDAFGSAGVAQQDVGQQAAIAHATIEPGVAEREWASPWLVAYQSQGARHTAWLGPSVESVIDATAGAGCAGIVIVPIGFATDHMETLYDLDCAAQEHARAVGLRYVRSAVPNAHPDLVQALVEEICAIAS